MQVTPDFLITYCTNVHPGADWETTFSAIEHHLDHIRAKVSENRPFGLGLRLSDKASRELAVGNRLSDFRDWLTARNTYVFTMNGFPFGNFHSEPVKDRVHHPDWTTLDRLEYTQRLFHQLAFLLPQGMEGGISTSPISYRHWHKTALERDTVFCSGADHMIQVAIELAELEKNTGQYMHLDIEPEPDGLLENSADVLLFFEKYLLPRGIVRLVNEYNVSVEEAKTLLLRHLTVCYDVCHFALAFENPVEVFSKFTKAGILVGKIQVSAALRIPSFGPDQIHIFEALKDFDEPIYLHQVTTKTPNGIKTWSDLGALFGENQSYNELRAHFHVPIFENQYGILGATQREILDVVAYLKVHPISRHLEVETYTWDVLPGPKAPLAESISRELNWLIAQLES